MGARARPRTPASIPRCHSVRSRRTAMMATRATGLSRASRGSCMIGVYPCANPDPLHCSTSCTQGPTGAPKCEVAALDTDGDGYGNAFCTKPGTDCDDANATIFPGASEICDGIDGN